ncbi:unnamed protein product [Rotaria sordida]|uniref:Uncharacterized protein n=1 Tax=Rotaria sordida TaxID=392033 RepID=A0A819RLS6_9BILA|nr:unnamed protein product [Rotaria sordida]CAF4042841.1 unnamed protein product [Rotaria sordida]
MSKVTEEKKELKALLIIGRNIKLTAETKKLFEQNDNCLIIGDGAENSVTSIDDIKAILEEKNYKIGLGTRIDISAHGNRTEEYKYHYTDFVEGSLTVQFFEKLTKIANIPLYVHLWSCYGGAANKSAHALGNGSILVTHIESKYPASTALDNYSKQASLTRYLNSGTPLTPYQQFILDLPENYQAATFIKVTDKNPKKFKTLRTTKDEIIVDILNTLDQHTSLTDAVNKFFKKTGEKFKEVFDKENITEAIKAVSTSNDKEIKDFVLGALIHVCGNKKIKEISELRQVKEIKERVRISEILEKLQNKGIDINNSIGGITPLHYACSTGNTEVARTLLEDKADREARTPEGDTPLHNACLLGKAAIVELLLHDVAAFPEESKNFLQGIKVWILDCIAYKSNDHHAGLDKILQWNKEFNPHQILLTNMNHFIDYHEILKILPSNIKPLYDGYKLVV